MKKNINKNIDFNKVYLYDRKPKFIPYLKRLIGFFVFLIISTYFIGYGIIYLKYVKDSILKNFFLNKWLIWILFFFIFFFIIYKSFKNFNTKTEKYNVSLSFYSLSIIFCIILIIILWTFTNTKINNKLKEKENNLIKNIDIVIKIIITLLIFFKIFTIIIILILKPKIDLKKVKKLNSEIIKLTNANLKNEEYIFDNSIYN